MEPVLKWVAIILLAPVVMGFVAQAVVLTLTTIFPYILFLAVVIGVVAGASAGLVLRHRVPPPSRDREDHEFPVPPPEPVRRPRGPRRRED